MQGLGNWVPPYASGLQLPFAPASRANGEREDELQHFQEHRRGPPALQLHPPPGNSPELFQRSARLLQLPTKRSDARLWRQRCRKPDRLLPSCTASLASNLTKGEFA